MTKFWLISNYLAFHPIGETRVKIDEIALRDDEQVAKIAKEYNKTAVQVMLRFHHQRGIIPIPKSSQLEHIKESKDITKYSSKDLSNNGKHGKLNPVYSVEKNPSLLKNTIQSSTTHSK